MAFALDADLEGFVLFDEVDGAVPEDGEVLGGLAFADAAVILAEGDVEDPVQAVLNGLITNDKFCVSRTVVLVRSRRLARPSKVVPGNDVVPLPPVGIPHGGDCETQMASKSRLRGKVRRTKAVGPCLPVDIGLGIGSEPGESAAPNRVSIYSRPGGVR